MHVATPVPLGNTTDGIIGDYLYLKKIKNSLKYIFVLRKSYNKASR